MRTLSGGVDPQRVRIHFSAAPLFLRITGATPETLCELFAVCVRDFPDEIRQLLFRSRTGLSRSRTGRRTIPDTVAQGPGQGGQWSRTWDRPGRMPMWHPAGAGMEGRGSGHGVRAPQEPRD